MEVRELVKALEWLVYTTPKKTISIDDMNVYYNRETIFNIDNLKHWDEKISSWTIKPDEVHPEKMAIYIFGE